MIFYHITDIENVNAILRDGLKPMPTKRHSDTQNINELLAKCLRGYRDDILNAWNNGVFPYVENYPDYISLKKQFIGYAIFEVVLEEIDEYAEKYAANHEPIDTLNSIQFTETELIEDLAREYEHSWTNFDFYGGEDGYEIIYEGSIPPFALRLVDSQG